MALMSGGAQSSGLPFSGCQDPVQACKQFALCQVQHQMQVVPPQVWLLSLCTAGGPRQQEAVHLCPWGCTCFCLLCRWQPASASLRSDRQPLITNPQTQPLQCRQTLAEQYLP